MFVNIESNIQRTTSSDKRRVLRTHTRNFQPELEFKNPNIPISFGLLTFLSSTISLGCLRICYTHGIDTKSLNDFSKQIYYQLRTYIPQLLNLFEEKPQSNGNLYLKIRAPIKDVNVWLGIYTDADTVEDKEEPTGEVSWEFDYYHSHSFDRNADDAFQWLKKELDELFEGRAFIGSITGEGKLLSSRVLNQHELDGFLAGKLDFNVKIDQIMKMTNISDSKKDRITKNLTNAANINRVVGWNNICLKDRYYQSPE
jgi:hypothetical protein